MDFGMPTLLETETLQDCIALCGSLGLQFIELNANLPQFQIHRLDAARLREARDKSGIYFTIHLDENLNICDFNDDVTEAYRGTVLKAIKLAREAGIPAIVMHLHKGIHISMPEKRVYLYEAYKRDYLRRILEFRTICQEAIGSSGITICVENTDGFLEHEKEALRLLLESECFGLTLDIGHSHVAKEVDEPFFLENIGRLRHMHIHDARGMASHLALGDGDVNLGDRLALGARHHCRAVLETKTVKALTASVGWLEGYRQG